ncbi:MAG TPA: hypothetical protein VK203_10415 [Nostocaceae cyanobacterium]|nr:hypothetical protein [Nostocaceae cyanobacterium]
MKLEIYDLDFNNLEQDLTDLNPWEMNKIQGGIRRRRRRNSQPFDVNTFADLQEKVKTTLDQWELNVDNTNSSIREQLGI